MKNDKIHQVSLFTALSPIILLVGFLAASIYTFGDNSLNGANQISLLFAAALAVAIAAKQGNNWEHIHDCITGSINKAMGAILILLMIGSLSGTWLLSGIVPTMIYYGLEILNPQIFLFASCIIAAIVSLAVGSSWTTAATVGIALVGIGKALGINEGLVAGAIISGAYFGDKMSPLSDTTNLAPAVAGAELFTHIRYLAYTSGPSILISLVIFLLIGFQSQTVVQLDEVASMQQTIQESFNITGWLFLVPGLVFVMIISKIPALPAIFIGAICGAVAAIFFQPELIASVAKTYDGPQQYFVAIMTAFFGSIQIATGNQIVDDLLKSKGMYGMLKTIWLILSAMVFGGAMQAAGLLQRISDAVMEKVHSDTGLVAATAATCGLANVATPDQYLAIAVPGSMYAESYKDRGLAPENLSRTLEDTGTVTSVLVPWNTCGAFQASVLGVATLSYLPFCFFNIISPFMTILFMAFKIKIARLKTPVEEQPAAA
jgi:NhaC family Na+:H+ antiporter